MKEKEIHSVKMATNTTTSDVPAMKQQETSRISLLPEPTRRRKLKRRNLVVRWFIESRTVSKSNGASDMSRETKWYVYKVRSGEIQDTSEDLEKIRQRSFEIGSRHRVSGV